jgi:hypothetical protein
MAWVTRTDGRNRWYERQIELASTPQEEFEILRGKLLADIKRLPEEFRDGVYENAIEALRGVIEGVGDVIDDRRRIEAYA